MTQNRLTAAEVSKLEEASNLLASGLPEWITRARKLINEVLCSAAPMELDTSDGSFIHRTGAGFIDDKEGWNF